MSIESCRYPATNAPGADTCDRPKGHKGCHQHDIPHGWTRWDHTLDRRAVARDTIVREWEYLTAEDRRMVLDALGQERSDG